MYPDNLGAMIASAQAGSAEAYEGLLGAYGHRLYGFFLRATGDHHDAEDLLGEVMLRLVSHLKDYDERGRFDAWLFRMAANLVRDRFRRAKTGPRTIGLSQANGSEVMSADQLRASQPGVDSGILADETSARLNEALLKLEAATREMIVLRHFGELSFREIADLTGRPIGTVLAKVHRGLRTLREHMEQHGGTE